MAAESPAQQPAWACRAIVGASAALLAFERRAVMALMFLLTGLILVNVVTRYTGMPIYWIDESAIYSVVWLTFIGASAMTRLRLDFAVTMLTERLPARAQRLAKVMSTSIVVAFALALLTMCWLWMEPLGIIRAGFDAREFAGQSFNFLYLERTQTLNWPTWVLYSIMPIFAASMTMHGLANLVEDLGLMPRATHGCFGIASAEAVNG
jgi:TRAP-type C4-dicarboxylate transport system permease small subunit